MVETCKSARNDRRTFRSTSEEDTWLVNSYRTSDILQRGIDFDMRSHTRQNLPRYAYVDAFITQLVATRIKRQTLFLFPPHNYCASSHAPLMPLTNNICPLFTLVLHKMIILFIKSNIIIINYCTNFINTDGMIQYF